MIKIIKNISGLTDSNCWQKTSCPFSTFRQRITIPLTSWKNDLFLYYQQEKIRFITNYLRLFKGCLNLYSSNAHWITTQWHKSIILTLNSFRLLHWSLTEINEVDDDDGPTSRDDICLPKAATSPDLPGHCLLSSDISTL